jgi:endoglycosylceramidase
MRGRIAMLAVGLWLALAGAAGAGASVAAGSPGSPGWPPAEPLRAAGRWIVDADGRVLVPRGLNIVDKRPPYLPTARGWRPEVARWMRRQGFDAVRLGWILRGLAPVRGSVEEAYLDGLERAVRIATDAGLLVLVDLHQDYFHERTGGEGFPDWMAPVAGPPPRPDALAFDLFWATPGWQDAVGSAWERVARRLAGMPGILGYDLLNEPFPGSREQACARVEGCRDFDETVLDPFFARAAAGARRGDPRRMVWVEPHVIFNSGAASWVRAPAGRGASGFSFHVYCRETFPGQAPCAVRRPLAFDHAEDVAGRTGMALLLSEFGATDDARELDVMAREADARMLPWLEWALWNHDPFAARPHEGLLRDLDGGLGPGNVKAEKLALLARPHPRAVAGTPLGWTWNPAARVLEVRWRPAPVPGAPRLARDAATEVVLPAVAYPAGWTARVSGGRFAGPRSGAGALARGAAEADVVRVVAVPDAREIVLRVLPGRAQARRSGGRRRKARRPPRASRPTRRSTGSRG